MRNILFRGKKEDNGEWVEGFYFRKFDPFLPGIDKTVIINFDDNSLSVWNVIDCTTLCEYTGLHDKNNKRIFERDIISIKNEVGEIYRFEVRFGKCGGTENVEHDVGYIGFYFEEVSNTIPVEYMLRKDPLYWLNEYDCEVIGNIFDNPNYSLVSIDI